MNKEILNKYISDNVNIPSSLGSLLGLLSIMYDVILSVKPKVAIELGTDSGSSTIALLESCLEANGTLYSFDKRDCPVARSNVKKYALESNWVFNICDSVIAAEKWDKKTVVDAVFLDTNHEYDLTVREIDAWFPLVRENGVMMFHDTISRVDEVQKAINEFLDRNEIKYFYRNVGVSFSDQYGLGVMIKIPENEMQHSSYKCLGL